MSCVGMLLPRTILRTGEASLLRRSPSVSYQHTFWIHSDSVPHRPLTRSYVIGRG